jgi:hypothetical protein
VFVTTTYALLSIEYLQQILHFKSAEVNKTKTKEWRGVAEDDLVYWRNLGVTRAFKAC